MGRITEAILLTLAQLFLLFIGFNPIDVEGRWGLVGQGLILTILLTYIVDIFFLDRKLTLTFSTGKRDITRSLLLGIMGYYIVTLLSLAIGKSVSTSYSLVDTLGTMSQVAPLVGITSLTIFFIVFVIGYSETLTFFTRLLEQSMDLLGVRFSTTNPSQNFSQGRFWGLIFFWGIIFTIFHLTAKFVVSGGFNTQFTLAMITVLIFGIVSGILVGIEGQSAGATFMHWIGNGVPQFFGTAGILTLALGVSDIVVFYALGVIGMLIIIYRLATKQPLLTRA